MQARQLSLAVTLSDEARFENYFEAENALALDALKQFVSAKGARSLLLWGAPSSGISHLLQACAHASFERGLQAQFLPLSELLEYQPQDVCDGLDYFDLVAVDGLDQVAGNRAWEQALFHLYNNLRDSGRALLLGSHVAPTQMNIELADFKSRVLGSPVYSLQSLGDADKQAAFQMRARARGLEVNEEVVAYIFKRCERDMASLLELLNRIDEASIREQRKVTIPFLRSLLENAG